MNAAAMIPVVKQAFHAKLVKLRPVLGKLAALEAVHRANRQPTLPTLGYSPFGRKSNQWLSSERGAASFLGCSPPLGSCALTEIARNDLP